MMKGRTRHPLTKVCLESHCIVDAQTDPLCLAVSMMLKEIESLKNHGRVVESELRRVNDVSKSLLMSLELHRSALQSLCGIIGVKVPPEIEQKPEPELSFASTQNHAKQPFGLAIVSGLSPSLMLLFQGASLPSTRTRPPMKLRLDHLRFGARVVCTHSV